MDILTQVLASILLFTSSLFGIEAGETVMIEQNSVELGLTEVSPNGPEGGYAVPASGCSDLSHGPIHDCDNPPIIDVDPPIIRVGETANVSWDPLTHTNCVLGGNMPSNGLSGSPAGNEDVSPNADSIYTIVCDGDGNEDSAYLRVLPRIQET